MTYQPRYIQGETSGAGCRDTEGRYAAMAERFPAHDFTMLDFGASSGYFCLRAAHERGAHAVAVDGISALRETLALAGEPRVRGVFSYLDPRQLQKLGRFDVGVCFSVLHHLDQWKDFLAVLTERCSTLFVECAVAEEGADIPDAERAAEVNAAVGDLADEVIAWTPGIGGTVLRPMYLLRRTGSRNPSQFTR